MKVRSPPQRQDFSSLERFHEAKAVWRVGYNQIVPSYKDEIEAFMCMDCSDWPYKSMRQLLAENPNHAGGLAQLAAAEGFAEERMSALKRLKEIASQRNQMQSSNPRG